MNGEVNKLVDTIMKWASFLGLIGTIFVGGTHYYYNFKTTQLAAQEAQYKVDRIERYLSTKDSRYWIISGELSRAQSPAPAATK
jgi:hypothetical protein